ncbi:MAG: hypothetical protein ACR2MS_03715 [Weeksellaceae bacterium]
MNSYALTFEAQNNVMACCMDDMDMISMLETTVSEHCTMEDVFQDLTNVEDCNSNKDCNDCTDDCGNSSCHSIVPSIVSLDIPRFQKGYFITIFPTQNTSNFQKQEDLFIDVFAHSIWHPPKV